MLWSLQTTEHSQSFFSLQAELLVSAWNVCDTEMDSQHIFLFKQILNLTDVKIPLKLENIHASLSLIKFKVVAQANRSNSRNTRKSST